MQSRDTLPVGILAPFIIWDVIGLHSRLSERAVRDVKEKLIATARYVPRTADVSDACPTAESEPKQPA